MNVKKIFALLLALTMVLGMGVNVFADGDSGYTITINNSVEGYEYEAYQIFTGDLSNSTLSNIEWGTNIDTSEVKDALGYEGAADYAEYLAGTGVDVTAEADKIAKCLTGNAVKTSSFDEENGKYVISGLDAGYYIVKNSTLPDNNDAAYAYTDYILEVVKDVTVAPKASVPEVEKKILEGTSKLDVNEASIGDTIKYELTGTLPNTLNTYNTYFYQFTDTLSKGLTYNNDVEVTVNGVDVTTYFYKNATVDSTTGKTTINISIADILALSLLKNDEDVAVVGNITKDSKVVVTYSATLNENAVIAGDGNSNTVKVVYSNDPNNSGEGKTTEIPSDNPGKPEITHPTGTTPNSTVKTYTTALTVLKNDGSGNVLTGAAFSLTGNGLNVVIITEENFEENANGAYYKLADGTYTEEAPVLSDPDATPAVVGNEDDYASTTTKYAKKIIATVDTTEPTGYVEDAEGEYYLLDNDTYSKTAPDNYAGKMYKPVYTVAEAEVDENGKLTFTGLGAGEYTLTETVTPAGYNTIDSIDFEVTFDATKNADGTYKVEFKSDNTNIVVGADNKLDITVVNNAGSILPSTGGIGTTIFYIVGGILVIGAAVLLITKKRMSSN